MSILEVEFGEPNEGWVKEAIERERTNALQRRQACLIAVPAMERLAELLKRRSDQPYKLRALLFSLWSGKPASLSEIVGLDWEIRQDLLIVLAAFGYEDSKAAFYYGAISDAICRAGEWDWFLEERFNLEPLKKYVESAERERKENA